MGTVTNHGRSSGFTLIEMLFSIVVMGIFGAAAVGLLRVQHQTVVRQNDGVLATQNVRAGTELLMSELRNAGYDAREAGAAITRMDVDTVAWTADLNGDGDVDDVGAGWAESVRYAYVESDGELWREVDATSALVLLGLDSLRFEYLDGDESPTTDPDAVEQIRVRIWYPTPDGALPGEVVTQVALRNNIYR